MAIITELDSTLQAALLKAVPAKSRVEIILDASDLNIDLSDYVRQDSPLLIGKRKQILPFNNPGEFDVAEINATMINRQDFFNPDVIGKQFYYAVTELTVDKGTGDAFVKVDKGAGALFTGITRVDLRQAKFNNVTAFTITSIDTTSDPTYDIINFSASGGVAYSIGDYIETPYLPGREVTIKTVVDGVATKVEQFKGILRSYPSLGGTLAQLTFYDRFKELLDVDCKANSYQVFETDGSAAKNTISYKRIGSSTGVLDLSQVTIAQTACKIGEWRIEFTDVGAYTITDTDGQDWTGFTAILQAFPKTGTIQITIPSGAWSGSFDVGDVITFKTTLALGSPINTYTRIVTQIQAMLEQPFGASLDSSNIDASSFTTIDNLFVDAVGQIAFTQPTTVLKVVETLQRHINSTLFVKNDGTFSLSAYYPRTASLTLSPDADIISVDSEDLGRVERVIAQFGYDYDTNKFTDNAHYPDFSFLNGGELEINYPAYRGSNSPAAIYAQRLWEMWRRGVRIFTISEKWNYGLALEINDLVKISSDHPTLGSRSVEIFDIQKDVNNLSVQIRCWDVKYSFANSFYLDDSRLDSGKKLW